MDMITAKRLAAGTAIAVIAVAALAPSIAINVAHSMNGGGEIPMLTVAVMSVLAAPLCLMAMPKLRAAGRLDVLAGAVMLFVLSLTFNMTNAVGLAGGARDHAREDRQGRWQRLHGLSSGSRGRRHARASRWMTAKHIAAKSPMR